MSPTVFDSLARDTWGHQAHEAGLPGRVDRETVACRSCGAETQSSDVCPACADAMREERAAALEGRCRIHRVRYVEDLPVSVLREMQAERCRVYRARYVEDLQISVIEEMQAARGWA